jgi:hypothetical protein
MNTTAIARITAAAAMRAIGQRRPRTTAAYFVCAPCAVTWSSTQTSGCWSCGQPPTSEHAHRSTATGLLLTDITPQPGR